MNHCSSSQSIVRHRFENFETRAIVAKTMGRPIVSKEVRAIVYAFLWICSLEGIQATRREDLERAAELAVERAAERAAERAVEKALESGNSTSESETIRESYSSVRKYDKSFGLPQTGYTPAQRREYDRIMREREAAERASAVLKRSIENEPYVASEESEISIEEATRYQSQRGYYGKGQKNGSYFLPRSFRAVMTLPFKAKDRNDPIGSSTHKRTSQMQSSPATGVHLGSQHELLLRP